MEPITLGFLAMLAVAAFDTWRGARKERARFRRRQAEGLDLFEFMAWLETADPSELEAFAEGRYCPESEGAVKAAKAQHKEVVMNGSHVRYLFTGR